MSEIIRGNSRGKKAVKVPQHLTTSCTIFHKGPKVPIADSGKTVRIISRSGVYVSKADGCIYRQKIACDFVATEISSGDVFIELKGSDVDHAVRQIDATLEDWRQKGWSGRVFSGLVVCTRYPRQDTKIQRMRSRFARRYGAALHVVRHGHEFEFCRLLAMDGPR